MWPQSPLQIWTLHSCMDIKNSLWGGCLYICHHSFPCIHITGATGSITCLHVNDSHWYQMNCSFPSLHLGSMTNTECKVYFWYDLGWDTYYIIIICSFKNCLGLLVLELELTLIDFLRAEQILFVFHFITTSWPLNECHCF